MKIWYWNKMEFIHHWPMAGMCCWQTVKCVKCCTVLNFTRTREKNCRLIQYRKNKLAEWPEQNHTEKTNRQMNNSEKKIKPKIMIMVFYSEIFFFVDIFIFEGNKLSVLHSVCRQPVSMLNIYFKCEYWTRWRY